MTAVLLLRFDAPLMSFGGPVVDNNGITQRFPALSMLVGLVANALGYDRRQFDDLERLQARLRYAVRCDRMGSEIIDYQTVDLGQTALVDTGWTTTGVREDRRGGGAREATHIRYRHYLADALYTVALSLRPADESPTLAEAEEALRQPARPLFIGRQCCLPAAPLVIGRVDAAAPLEALRVLPPATPRADSPTTAPAWWAVDEPASPPGQDLVVTDRREWQNQIHVGRRLVRHGTLQLRAKGAEG